MAENNPETEFGTEPTENWVLSKEVAFVEFVFDAIMKKCKNNPSLIGNADRAFYQKTHNGQDPPDYRRVRSERIP